MPLLEKARRAFTIGTARITRDNNTPFVAVGRKHHPHPALDVPSQIQLAGNVLYDGKNQLVKPQLINHSKLVELVNSDPVTWGLVRIVRQLISQTPFEIVPDTIESYKELDRWEDQSQDCVNKWGYTLEFQSRVLTQELVNRVNVEVSSIIKSSDDDSDKRHRISALFRIIKRELDQEAEYNCAHVKKIFNRPNNHLEKSFRALLELIVNGLVMDDAGIVIKNYDDFGRLAELWNVPGYELNVIMNDDYTVPQPPDPAYVWRQQGQVKGWFTNRELTYMMANPQGNGFGMSPVEALVYINIATTLGNTKLVEALKEGQIPPFLLNLKDATDPQRIIFEKKLYDQMMKGGGNRALVLNGVPSEDGEFQYQELPRGPDFQKIQIMEYLKMAPSIKAFVFGFQADDLGLIMDASRGKVSDASLVETLSQRRGITGYLTLIEEYINSEIIKQEFPGIVNVKGRFKRYDGSKPSVSDQATADSVRVAAGLDTRNAIRERDGLRPIPGGHKATIATGNAIIPVDALDSIDFSKLTLENLPGMNMPDTSANATVAPGSGATRKRNDANKRLQTNGHENRAVKKEDE